MSGYTSLSPEKAWELVQRRLDEIPLDANRHVVERYLRRRRTQHIAPSTLGANAGTLSHLAVWLKDKGVLDVTPDDVEDYFYELSGTLRPSTQYHYWVIISTFYRQVTGKKEPEQLGSFQVKRPNAKHLRAQDLLTDEDLDAILRISDVMEKAVATVLYDVGFRNGELRALNVGSVEAQDGEIILHLPDVPSGLKTGPRECLVFGAHPYLSEWLNHHQFLDKPDFPLFYHYGKRHNSGKAKRIDANWMAYYMRRINERSGITKHVWCHLFRHTSATNMARRGVQESVMRRHFGWSTISDMPSVYVHLAQEDHMDALRIAHGLQPKQPRWHGLRKQVCPHCNTENPHEQMLCITCRRPVTPTAGRLLRDNTQNAMREELAKMVGHMLKEEMAGHVHTLMVGEGNGNTAT